MIGYLLAVLIGLSLGLMGGGGSILAVPVLHYVVGYGAKESIAMSLAVVGGASALGAVSHWHAGNIDGKVAALFGSIAMAGTFLGAKLAAFISGTVQLVIFAAVMLAAAYFMFDSGGGGSESKKEMDPTFRWFLIAGEGLTVGVLTGIVGVGGGFLIVPALVLLANVSMKTAVGTSLIIIAMKSMSGFVGYLGQITVDWVFLAIFTGLSMAGIVVGSQLVRYVSAKRLKRGFAIFLVIMGTGIFIQNVMQL